MIWKIFFVMVFLLLLSAGRANAYSPVYRFWSNDKQHHFYTISETEKDYVIATYPESTWQYEGSSFQASETQVAGTFPVYRFWSNANQGHFYTISETEKDYIVATYPTDVWQYERVAYYAYPSQVADTTPIYRFWSNTKQGHFYTTSSGEKNCITNNYSENVWQYERQAWWVITTGANLSTDENSCGAFYGPSITIGLWSNTRDGLRDNPFKLIASKDYDIRDKNNDLIAQISAGTKTRVTYDGDKNLKIYNSIPDTLSNREVRFEATDGDNSTMIFDVYRPSSSYDQYRGRIKLKYSDTTDNIWVINTLPLEHYVWGDGELTGTGDMDYNRVMATSFRTYGYWKILYSTAYATEGFKVNATPGNQLYYGYDWEKNHSRIKSAAQDTKGSIVYYNNDVALTPYSSWTDGRTRSFEERWESSDYPWCQSVSDPYGKHPTKSTATLEAEGNHMVGVSANGALSLARDHGWDWDVILNYYYTGISINEKY